MKPYADYLLDEIDENTQDPDSVVIRELCERLKDATTMLKDIQKAFPDLSLSGFIECLEERP